MKAWACSLLIAASLSAQDVITIGAKNFTESAVLAEVMAQLIEQHTDLVVERRTGLGGTLVCWGAVRAGKIDLYAEYTGTGWTTILQRADKVTDPLQTFLQVQAGCRAQGVEWLRPFGLDNSYALAMPEQKAEQLGIRTISDLRAHQDTLRVGFGIEFGNRNDGYPGLARAYQLSFANMRTIEHALAYEAIQAGEIDLMDAYSTDGKLRRYGLRVLEDDRRFFPPYDAAPVVNAETLEQHPEIATALAEIAFRITDEEARQLNLDAETADADIAAIVRAFLAEKGVVDDVPAPAGASRFWTLLLQHVWMTLVAVVLATFAAVPTGIFVARRPALRSVTLAGVGVLQTIPSLALLAVLVPLLGLGVGTAIVALFLYALLPIVRNACTGIVGVAPELVDAARGMGMRPKDVLRLVELPLALPTIMAGVRTAAVISVGVATLAAFVGGGGFGEPILEGLYLNDVELILDGAVPAAALAILVDNALGVVERRLTPGPAGTPSP